ncbi:hypothetical protein KI688_011341 [Linnemannia hyalina]|uniref:RING-type domain-containing protein n=1 Tax=Linnemannia hyalina TaxID=64524 RepID=A0A9P7XXK9_9FUNG|nr:hypothetical protein KI688_011341 [Linnemannia hyalina]
MHPPSKAHNHSSISQYETGSDGEREILPDTTVGILRRMAEEIKCPICLGTMERPVSTGCNHTFCHECILHALSRSAGCPLCKSPVHKRGLNRVDHLEQVIEAFNQLKEAFEQEDGHTLSQAPRHFETEPQENLTQLYPYPEKADEPSSTEQSQYGEENDMDCFDVDLDSVSADQAALLAEKMLAMIFLEPPNESASHQASSSSRRADHLVPQSHSPTHAVVVKQESDADDDEDEATQPRQDHTQVKAEPTSSLDMFFSGPTQERASKEINVVICGTYLSPQKKTRMDSVSKSLKGKTINDLTRILASQEAGYWVDESSYQIADNEMKCNPAKLSRASRSRGDRPLFTNYEFQLAGPFVTPTRDEMELMIKIGGGTAVPRLSQRDRSTAANDGGNTKHVLLYDQTNDGVLSLKKLKVEIESVQEQALSIGKTVSIVPCKVLLDCISQYDMDKMVETIPS